MHASGHLNPSNKTKTSPGMQRTCPERSHKIEGELFMYPMQTDDISHQPDCVYTCAACTRRMQHWNQIFTCSRESKQKRGHERRNP